jgi:hypothetical protein
MNNLRVNLPGAVDDAILLEVFNTVDDLCQNWLQIAPPVHGTDLTTWLSSADWLKYYRLVVYGTLARMQAQPGKPYSNPDLAKFNIAGYRDELIQARGEAASGTVSGIYEALMDTLRLRLPGARDGTMHVEMFNVIDEICRTTHAFRKELEITPVVNQQVYNIATTGFEVLITYQVTHDTLGLDGSTFDANVLTIPSKPTASDVADPLILEASVTPVRGGADTPSAWLDNTHWSRFYQAILDGTLFRMHSQVAKPYTSQPNSVYHGRRFRSEMAKLTARAGHVSEIDPQGWSFPLHTR